MADESLTQDVAEVGTALPTGAVTFLFSDIGGSTQMLEAHRAAAGTALARHHELLVEAVEDASGVAGEDRRPAPHRSAISLMSRPNR